jgi:hypothetical protein
MSLTCTEEEYPGYQRRMFECLVCGEIMTQWAGVHQKAFGGPNEHKGLLPDKSSRILRSRPE